MDSLQDLLSIKANNLDDSSTEALRTIQAELDTMHNGLYKAQQVNGDNQLLVTTKSSSAASELRMQQVQLLHTLKTKHKLEIAQLRIRIAAD